MYETREREKESSFSVLIYLSIYTRVVPKKFEHYFQSLKCTLVLADSISDFIFALALVEILAWPLLGKFREKSQKCPEKSVFWAYLAEF